MDITERTTSFVKHTLVLKLNETNSFDRELCSWWVFCSYDQRKVDCWIALPARSEVHILLHRFLSTRSVLAQARSPKHSNHAIKKQKMYRWGSLPEKNSFVKLHDSKSAWVVGGKISLIQSCHSTQLWVAAIIDFAEVVKEVIKEHKKTLDLDNPRDFVDAFFVEINKGSDASFSVSNYLNFWKSISKIGLHISASCLCCSSVVIQNPYYMFGCFVT